MTAPAIGRIVLYTDMDGEHEYAAIITLVHDFGRVNLTVFCDGRMPMLVASVSRSHNPNIAEPTHWRFPPGR